MDDKDFINENGEKIKDNNDNIKTDNNTIKEDKNFNETIKPYLPFLPILISLITILILICEHRFNVEQHNLNRAQIKKQDSLNTVQNIKIDEYQYENLALQHKPELIVVGYPKIDSVSIVMITKEQTLKRTQLDTSEIKFFMKVKSRITLKNEGNNLAKIIAYIARDTVSDEPFISEVFLSKDTKKIKFHSEFFEPFFKNEIRPNDTKTIEFELHLDLSFAPLSYPGRTSVRPPAPRAE